LAEIPEHILRRSAEARAAAEGRDPDEVYAEMTGEAPPASAAPPAPDAGATPQPAAAPTAEAAPVPAAAAGGARDIEAESEQYGVPSHLLERSMQARASADGTGFPAVGTTTPPAAPVAAEPEPIAEQPTAEPEAATAVAAAVVAAPAGASRDLEAEAAEYGVPAPLLERAMYARARHDGTTAPAVGAAPTAPATAPAAATATPGVAAAAAPAAAPAIPEGVRTQRLLTVVKAGAIQQVKREPQDKVNVWPHLLAIELVALMAVTAFLFVFSAFVDAPLLEFANFNEQPNPSKAPWYFLGLQELLSYFDPQVAGVLLPGFGLVGLAFIPYVDRNPSVRPSDRKLAIMIFTFFVMASAILTIFGSFFRGPGFNFSFPWVDGIFFDF